MQEDDTNKLNHEVEAVEKTVKPKLKYHVVTVEKTVAPEGMPGDNWHRYVIGQGGSKIEGTKPGSMKAVTEHAKAVAADLNERSGRGGSNNSPRKRV